MPHVIVKLWPGNSEKQKRQLAGEITRSALKTLRYGEESVSVAFEEIEASDWSSKVYQPDIVSNASKVYKRPGYTL